jgi:tetratricopeptide (TPR) repeat protein
MDYLRNWREYIPTTDRISKERLYSWLALVVMIVIGLADIFFVRSYIVPRLRERRELASQLASAEKALTEAKRAQEESPERLRKQVATAQARLNDVANVFLSDSQAAEALNRLYQYASESQVEIVDLRTQPAPKGKEKGAYDVRKFQLQADGDLPNLMDFISRIKEAALESFMITNVNITEGEELHTLSMDITLYTSPYSPGAVVKATPGVTATPASLAQLEERLGVAWTSGEWEQAIGLIEQILAIDPDYDDMVEKLYAAHVNYGYQLLGKGNPDGATAQFNIALEIKSDGAEALAGLQQAATWMRTPTPIATPPGTPPPTLTVEERLAQSLHEPWAAGDWETVIGLIEQILAINPDYDDMVEKLYAAHVNYGRQLAAEGRLEEAKEEFMRALAIKPDGGEAIAELHALAAGETPVPPLTPTPQPQYIIHVVQRGENLFRIALRYNTTVQAIMAANGLTDYTIHVGQELRIPIY